MAGPPITMRVRTLFFDTAKVQREVTRARRASLSKAGAFIRRTARSSMRKKRKPSLPGKPPRVVSGELKKFLFFSYEPSAQNVVIGPVGFRKSKAPATLEFGGKVVVRQRKARRGRKVVVKRKATVKPRPFMGPALRKEIEKGTIGRAWRNSIRSSGGKS